MLDRLVSHFECGENGHEEEVSPHSKSASRVCFNPLELFFYSNVFANIELMHLECVIFFVLDFSFAEV